MDFYFVNFKLVSLNVFSTLEQSYTTYNKMIFTTVQGTRTSCQSAPRFPNLHISRHR